MITYKTGNILEAKAEALVNTVNTVGVMGKGIALQFKTGFPENYDAYIKAVNLGQIKVGTVQIVSVFSTYQTKYVINFPTKAHWRFPSKLQWIKDGLEDLKSKIIEYNIKSIALPPLGCGNGGLKWEEVRPIMEGALKDLPVDVTIYEPSLLIKEVLKKEEKKGAKKLTAVRAMLLFLLYRYRALGEHTSEFASEKLCYFLQRFGEKQLKLVFQKGAYGPYSGKVRHLLYIMNGYYLRGYEQKDLKPFEPLEIVTEKAEEVRLYVEQKLSEEEKRRLQKVSNLIDGFESPYGLELLATTDMLIDEAQTLDADTISNMLWNQRKKELFPKRDLEVAINHLSKFTQDLYTQRSLFK